MVRALIQTDPDRGVGQPRLLLYLQDRAAGQDSAVSAPGWFYSACSMRVTAAPHVPLQTSWAPPAAVGRIKKHLIGWSRFTGAQ